MDVLGYWKYEGTSSEDRLQRVTIVAADTAENEVFMREYKETLKKRFEQIEIWMTVQRIDVI